MATYLELKKQIEDLQSQAEKAKAMERDEVIVRMKEAISVYDITAQELGLGGRGTLGRSPAVGKRGTPKAKPSQQGGSRRTRAYADGQGNTWGGRGPRPQWLRDALAGGATLEQFSQN